MLFLWLIAIALGIFALWLAFWVIMFVIGLFAISHEEIAYRRAEKHHPGIYARHKRILAIREAKRKEKEAYEKWSKERMASISRREREESAHRTASAFAALANS